MTETIGIEIAKMNTRVSLTIWAIENQTLNQIHNKYNKFKISKPKAFSENHIAKELENFIFNIKQYFKSIGTSSSKETKVTLATMHLIEDMKLWWRSKVNDIQNGPCAIDA